MDERSAPIAALGDIKCSGQHDTCELGRCHCNLPWCDHLQKLTREQKWALIQNVLRLSPMKEETPHPGEDPNDMCRCGHSARQHTPTGVCKASVLADYCACLSYQLLVRARS